MPKDVIIEEVNRIVKPRTCNPSRRGFHRIYDVVIDFSKYAPLMPSAVLKEGDQYYDNGNWWATTCIGKVAGNMFQYRRALDNIISKSTAIQ